MPAGLQAGYGGSKIFIESNLSSITLPSIDFYHHVSFPTTATCSSHQSHAHWVGS